MQKVRRLYQFWRTRKTLRVCIKKSSTANRQVILTKGESDVIEQVKTYVFSLSLSLLLSHWCFWPTTFFFPTSFYFEAPPYDSVGSRESENFTNVYTENRRLQRLPVVTFFSGHLHWIKIRAWSRQWTVFVYTLSTSLLGMPRWPCTIMKYYYNYRHNIDIIL